MLSPELQAWHDAGEFVRTALGHRVFCRQLGDPQAAPDRTLLLLHGFPESSYSFHKVIDALAERFDRVVVFDMIGYGLSDKPVEGYTYSLFEQADTALQVWRQLGVRGGHLIAHDMGDSVATELVAREVGGLLPAWFDGGFASYTFTNGSMVLDLADLRITQKLLLSRAGPLLSRLFNRRTFDQQVRSAQGTDRLSDADLDRMWENILHNDGRARNHLLIRYLDDRRRFEKTRWLPSLARTQVPVHLCWGEADAVASVTMADYLKANVCTDATVTRMPGVGHFCQISDPEPWLAGVTAFHDTLRN